VVYIFSTAVLNSKPVLVQLSGPRVRVNKHNRTQSPQRILIFAGLFISPPFQIHSAANGLRWSLLSIIHGWLIANPGYVNNAPRHSVRDVRCHRWVCCGSRVVESSISNELLGQNRSRVVLLISTSYGLPADKASLDLSLTLCPARTNKSRALCPSWPFNTS